MLEMDATIDANAVLDYIEFQVFPSLNRYETWAFCADNREKVASGLLENLLLHSAEAKSLHSKGSNSKFILNCSIKLQKIKWFTKSTLIRFLHIIGSPNILDATKSLAKEISQLEEARIFHLSLYNKGTKNQLKNEESGSNSYDGTGSSPNAEGSDFSINKLLRAMDLRLSALREELIAAFDQAAGSTYFVEDLIALQKFSENFGSGDLSGLLLKYIQLREGSQAIASISSKSFSEAEDIEPEKTRVPTIEPSLSELQEESTASPVKAANVESRNVTESERYSLSSEGEEQPSVERSRTLARSFSPRRSASPMRRVQIGRSGSRRSTAITIKSLNYFPARDRSFMAKDACSDSGDEEPERPMQKTENSVKRMSVQDAIHLFESKQRDQTVDVHKVKSSVNPVAISSNKSVLRRWSSGIVEDTPGSVGAVAEASEKDNQVCMKNEEITDDRSETEFSPIVSKDISIENCRTDAKLNSPEVTCDPESMQKESLLIETTGNSDKLVASEWSRQKESELDELLMKMMESKPVKVRTSAPANTKTEVLHSELRGGSYNQYKEKRDEKLSGSAAKKVVTDKSKRAKAVQNVVEAKKIEPSSTVVSDASKKPTKKIQRQQKKISESANPKSGTAPAGIVKKAPPKASSLPATRKSWPSMASTKVTGASPAKGLGLTSSTGAMPARRKSTPAVTKTSPKDTSSVQGKPVKTIMTDNKKSSRTVTGMKQPSVLKRVKIAESKLQNSSDKTASHGKPSLYSKVTKKSSVVPLEPKPFLRRSSGIVPIVSSATSKETSSDSQEPLRKSEDLILTEKSLSPTRELVVTQHKPEPESEPNIEESYTIAVKESDSAPRSPQKFEELSQVEPVSVDNINRVAESEMRIKVEEECTISPQAWVEIEEPEDHSNASGDHISQLLDSPTNLVPVRESSPRVRHSLSQMLLEEIHEHDEWRNAEYPHSMVYHKDEPKGLKRLLKFGRKTKSDANSNGCSSPSAFSEVEDDAEIASFVNKRNPENLMRKATLNPKNSRHHNGADEKSAQGYKSSPRQLVEGNISASVTSTKARSFFSLTAFKSSK